jgi:hypothetical protein
MFFLFYTQGTLGNLGDQKKLQIVYIGNPRVHALKVKHSDFYFISIKKNLSYVLELIRPMDHEYPISICLARYSNIRTI